MSNPQPPQQQRGIIGDFVTKVFDWLDKPWKAIALAGLGVLIALGYGGWMSRDTIADAWKMSSGRPILKRSELPEILIHLRRETTASIVAYSSLNLSANSLNFEAGVNSNGQPWDFTPHRLPAIRDKVSTPQGLSELISGQVICRNPKPEDNGDLFNRRMVLEKITRLCLIPVPPAPNILVGILLIAWVNSPDKPTEEAALGLARETASTMVSRWE